MFRLAEITLGDWTVRFPIPEALPAWVMLAFVGCIITLIVVAIAWPFVTGEWLGRRS